MKSTQKDTMRFIILKNLLEYDMISYRKSESQAATLLILLEGLTLQTKERGALPMITYSDLIQTGIFIVALVGLCYTIFKEKRKQPSLFAVVTAVCKNSLLII